MTLSRPSHELSNDFTWFEIHFARQVTDLNAFHDLNRLRYSRGRGCARLRLLLFKKFRVFGTAIAVPIITSALAIASRTTRSAWTTRSAGAARTTRSATGATMTTTLSTRSTATRTTGTLATCTFYDSIKGGRSTQRGIGTPSPGSAGEIKTVCSRPVYFF